MSDPADPNGYPLAKLKVLDFSRVLAGPFASRMLADLGADVIKVEPPDGDITRLWGHVVANLPGYYHQQNVGKRNICIDLQRQGATELVFALAQQADVLIENFRADVMPRLGIGYATLAEINPRLIMLSISGFGSGGPESHRPAYAPIVHAESGLLARQSRRGGIPFRDLPLSVADTNAALHGLVGLLAAVIQREQTGVGQHVEIAMIDATVATDDQLQYDLENSEHTGPLPNDIWQTGAGWALISADFRHLWRMLIADHGVIDPTDKAMELSEKIRLRRDRVAHFFASLATWDEVEVVMKKMNLAWGRVRDPADIRQQPTIDARHAIVDVDDRAGGVRPVTQSPYRFSKAKSGIRGPAPHRGEHNADVLEDWLGMTGDQIAALSMAGVLLVDESSSQ